MPVAPLLVALVNQTSPITHHPTSRVEAYAAAAMADECEAIRSAAAGTRNHTLNAAAFAAGQLVAGGMLDAVTARHVLKTAAAMAGLSKAEAGATITSGMKAGAKSPRTMLDDDAPATAATTAPVQHAPAAPRALNWFTGTQAASAPPVERESLIADLIPTGIASLLTGDGGVGKSLVTTNGARHSDRFVVVGPLRDKSRRAGGVLRGRPSGIEQPPACYGRQCGRLPYGRPVRRPKSFGRVR